MDSTEVAEVDRVVERRYRPALNAPRVQRIYERWVLAHEQAGGDHDVLVHLDRLASRSVADTNAKGLVHLDLIEGEVMVRVEGLDDVPEARDVWLVDNRDGGSVLPDEPDALHFLGQLPEDSVRGSVLEASVDPAELSDFDVVVVSLQGQLPTDGGVLFGRVPLFNRIFSEQRQKTGGLDALAARAAPPLAFFEDTVSEGFELFTEETFDGNGRTCATCHRVENDFTIDPAFIATLPDSDPLFVHENDPTLAELESPQMLRQLGLIRANVDGPDRLARLRSVPHIKGIAASINVSAGPCARTPVPDPACGFPPAVGPFDLRNAPILFGPLARARVREGLALGESTGWGGDGAPHDGTLFDFAVGAIAQHFTLSLDRQLGVDFRAPTPAEADALLMFQLSVGRDQDVDTATITFHDPKAALGFAVYTNSPGGCIDETGEGQCACGGSITGNQCARDLPSEPRGAACSNCHDNAGANSDFSALSNVRNLVNANFDIGTAGLPHPVAEQIAAASGEPLPLDCGLGQLSAAQMDPWCRYSTSWFPYDINGPCNGLVEPSRDVYCADPIGDPSNCTAVCGGMGEPECNGWSQTVPPESGQRPLPGRDPDEVFAHPNGWYTASGSLCDTPGNATPVPIITTGIPNQAACESFVFPAEWTPNGGIGGAPACKCVDDSSCDGVTPQFCFRQAGNPIDGWCLGLEAQKTTFDPANPDHVARAGNRVMIEPVEPDWAALPTFGSPCSVPPPGVPSACFGPLVCDGPFPGAAGTCSENPQWQPEVLSFCEVTETYPNPALPFGCFPGSPDPACQGCQAFCAPGDDSCVACFLPGKRDERVEQNCPADHDPGDPALAGFGDGSFSTPPLIESPDTGPYFHNHSAATLEDAIRHYASDEFFESPMGRGFGATLPRVFLDDDEVDQIAAYLRVLGAAQNVSEAQRAVVEAYGDSEPNDPRAAFADVEVADAVELLAQSNVHEASGQRFAFARNRLDKVLKMNKSKQRDKFMAAALYHIDVGRQLMLTVNVDPANPSSGFTAEHLTPQVPAAIASAVDVADEEDAFAEFLEEGDDDD